MNISYIVIVMNYLQFLITCGFTRKTDTGGINPCTYTKCAILSLHLMKIMVVAVVFVLVTCGDGGGGNGGCAFSMRPV
jgi:hypothetical protein